MTPACSVIVFAKAPVPGQVKTRLAGVLGEAGAAALAQRMLERSVEAALAADIGPVEICCAPDPTHPVFAELAQRHAIALTHQGTGDLGLRMHRAFERVLRGAECALLIGTDAPGLTPSVLREAAVSLQAAPTAFVPAADGGYVLVGLRRPMLELFEDMTWSVPTVMDATRARLRKAGRQWVELEPVHDVDEPSDLIHLPKEWSA